jgi:mycothiol synthase
MTLTSRDYLGVTDIAIVTAYFDSLGSLHGHDRAALHAGDVWWRFGQYEPELHQMRLWFEAEKLIGLGWVIAGSRLEIHIHPSLESVVAQSLGQEIMTWAKSICPQEISCESIPENERLIALLLSSGFVRQDFEMQMYSLDLRQPVPDVVLPSGFEVRAVRSTEMLKRVEAHRDAFASTKFTPERYARVRSMPGYKSELDLVIANAQQQFAAFCIVWLSDGVGLFEPVGTRATFRRQGLGRAVILAGFLRLRALGAHTALVVSEPHNQAFYQSCGFRVLNRFVGYEFTPTNPS